MTSTAGSFARAFVLVGFGCKPTPARPDLVDAAAPAPSSSSELAVSAPPIASSVATPRADPRKPTGLPAATLEAIEQADSVEVFYLDPEGSFDPKPVDTRAKFHDYPIIEKGKLKPSRAALVAAIQMGIKRFNGSFARRFNPRHGVRAVYRGVTHDLVICFECRRIMINGDPTPLIGVDEASASGFDDVFSRSGLKKKAAVRP